MPTATDWTQTGIHTKESNQQLRAELKTAFPGVKFSVRMRPGYTQVVDIKYVEPLNWLALEEIANRFTCREADKYVFHRRVK